MMLIILKTALCIFAAFTALGIACAVRLALRREGGIGRGVSHPQAADPFDPPIGEVMGFSREQLDHFARRSRLSMRRDPLNRFLDFSECARDPRRITATGGRSMPFGAFARRTPSDEVAR